MGDRAREALEKARGVLRAHAPLLVAKTMWASPAGKKRLSVRLAQMLPAHKIYTEPFVGSGAVLFAKTPAATEAINDADPEIAGAYRIIKRLTRSDLGKLGAMSWKGDADVYARLKSAA